MRVRALKTTTPGATYRAHRVRATHQRDRAAAAAPKTGATTQDGKYIP